MHQFFIQAVYFDIFANLVIPVANLLSWKNAANDARTTLSYCCGGLCGHCSADDLVILEDRNHGLARLAFFYNLRYLAAHLSFDLLEDLGIVWECLPQTCLRATNSLRQVFENQGH